MKTIDFKHFRVFTDITQKETVEADASFQFADMLYKKSDGIVAHDLALRIYRAEGPVKLRDEEQDALKSFVEANCTPLFIDSYNSNIS